MEDKIELNKLIREIFEPIIDDCVSRAFNKNINELKFEKPVNYGVFDIKEVMAYLRLNKGTIYKMTMDREIPHYKKGRRLYFKKEDIDDWINNGKVKTKEETRNESYFNSYRGRK